MASGHTALLGVPSPNVGAALNRADIISDDLGRPSVRMRVYRK